MNYQIVTKVEKIKNNSPKSHWHRNKWYEIWMKQNSIQIEGGGKIEQKYVAIAMLNFNVWHFKNKSVTHSVNRVLFLQIFLLLLLSLLFLIVEKFE